MRIVSFCAALLFNAVFGSAHLFGKIVSESFYINDGSFIAVDTTAFPYYSFNRSQNFDSRSPVIHIAADDTLRISIFNNSTEEHDFRVRNYSGSFSSIAPGSSVSYDLTFSQTGVYIMYDGKDFPKYAYLGLTGMIVVTEKTEGNFFYWNLKEHQKKYNFTFSNDSAVNWKLYKPDYFTINGLSYPQLQQDDSAVITGKVGDTIYVFVANTGQSIHSIHFHGYHATTVFSTDKKQQGWEKDTWLMDSYETFILRLVPDKPGKFPVHDHNLVALSGGGRYPNGMLIMMEIK